MLKNPDKDFQKIINLIEKKILQSEIRSKKIYDNSIEGICILDSSAEITLTNQCMAEIFGYSNEEMIGKSIFSLIDEKKGKPIKKHLKNRKKGISERYIAKLSHRNGKDIYVQIKAAPLYDEHGKYDGSVAFVEDITEKQKTEQLLRASEEKFKNLYEEAPNAYFSISNNKVIIGCNKAAEKLLYYSKEKLLEMSVFDLYSNAENGLPKARRLFQRFLKGDIIRDEELIMKKSDGTPVWVGLSVSPVFDDKGNIIESRSMVIDITKRKLAEEKLKKSEQRYRDVIQDQTDLIVRWRINGILTFVNESYCDFFQKSREELVGTSFLPLIPEEDHDLVKRNFSLITLKNPIMSHEHRVFKPDGTLAWIHWMNRAIIDENNNIIEYQAVGRDITGKMRAELNLKESEEKYRSLFENSPVALMDQDLSDIKKYVDHLKASGINDFNKYFDENPDDLLKIMALSKIKDVNRKTIELYEAKNKEDFMLKMKQLSENIDQSMTAELFLYNKMEILSLINGKTMYNSEIETKTFKGKFLFLYAKTSVMSGFENTWSNVMVSIVDLTARKKIEENLKASEEKYRNLVETSSMGLLEIDFSTKMIAYVNPKLLEIMGYKYEELIQEKAFQNLIYHEDLNKMDFTNIDQKLEFRVVTKDGKIKWLSGDRIHFYDEDGNLIYIRLWLQDITEKKEIEEIKTNLLVRFSHEFKTPLISIKGFTDFLLEEYRDKLSEKIVSFLENIKNGAEKLTSLTNSFLESSQLDGNLVRVKIKQIDVLKLVNRVLKGLEGIIILRHHVIDLKIEENLTMSGDPEKLHIVLSNLVLNASKYTPRGGLITISSTKENGFAVISVKDNGIGLTQNDIQNLFKPFGKIERYGQGLDVVTDGMGMGLFITKELVELHKGKIWAESTGRNRGSNFIFKIPIIQ
jgi:PAS domain S-box-containing protein